MANILDEIFEYKVEEVSTSKRTVPLIELKDKVESQKPPLDVLEILRDGKKGSRIIAEIKRRTPFKGDLIKEFDAHSIAKTYMEYGASAISILTDQKYFGGSLQDFETISRETSIPLLRKDFILSEYQVYESRASGADFFLLIATSLEKNHLSDLLALGKELGLVALIETHNEKDVEKAFYAGATLLGINNRDLTSGKTDLDISRRLLKMVSQVEGLLLVCESGIKSKSEIDEFEGLGMDAFLIGESLMTAENRSEKLQELVGNVKKPTVS